MVGVVEINFSVVFVVVVYKVFPNFLLEHTKRATDSRYRLIRYHLEKSDQNFFNFFEIRLSNEGRVIYFTTCYTKQGFKDKIMQIILDFCVKCQHFMYGYENNFYGSTVKRFSFDLNRL